MVLVRWSRRLLPPCRDPDIYLKNRLDYMNVNIGKLNAKKYLRARRQTDRGIIVHGLLNDDKIIINHGKALALTNICSGGELFAVFVGCPCPIRAARPR